LGITVPSAEATLAPTARRLLKASRRLLEQSGYSALSLDAIGREAGENKSLIGYYFGGKAGLLVALADWLLHDSLRHLQQRVEKMPPGPERQRVPTVFLRELAADSEAYRLFYALLPHLIEHRNTRHRLGALYAEYRAVNMEALSLSGDPLQARDGRVIASMVIALTDGLALQLLADPGGVELDRAVELWDEFVQLVLGGSRVTSDPDRQAQASERGAEA
jgi:AcrR family transcriptional regulator